LFLNRIVPEKGAHYLIEAYNRIGRDDVKQVIGGNVDPRDRYLDSLGTLAGNNENTVFTGYLTDEEVREMYSNAYLFVLPSDLEGMPAVVLEAMSHRCPVLVSDIQECTDIIRTADHEYGYVHKASDVDDLAAGGTRPLLLRAHGHAKKTLFKPTFRFRRIRRCLAARAVRELPL
jgi:glycosyltransferase involved in cell wall biosynthesis